MVGFFLEGFGDLANFLPQQNIPIPFSPEIILIGIALIAATIFIGFFLKKVVMNSILGGVIWFVSVVIFKVELPFIPSLVISLLFGPAGIGTMILLAAFGLIKP